MGLNMQVRAVFDGRAFEGTLVQFVGVPNGTWGIILVGNRFRAARREDIELLAPAVAAAA